MTTAAKTSSDAFIVIGITGTIGAGKGTVVDYLKKKYGFEHYSARTFLYTLVDAKKMERNRDSLRLVANELRAKDGPAAVAIALFEEAKRVGKNAIIESIRTEGEIQSLRSRKLPFVLLAVDADPKIRYARITSRGSKTDDVSFEDWTEQERKEMTSKDPTKQNLSRCMELADVKILNNGTFEEFSKEIDKVASKLMRTST
eukprot:g1948.t1